MFKNRMRIIRGADLGSIDWSPTAQHVERMKRRRWRKIKRMLMLVALAVALIVLSLALGSFVHVGR